MIVVDDPDLGAALAAHAPRIAESARIERAEREAAGSIVTAVSKPGTSRRSWGEDEGLWARKETTRFWGSTVVSVVEDLTREKREEDDLRNAASHGFLTGLLNRRAFEQSARKKMSRWQRGRDPLSLLVIDAECAEGASASSARMRRV